MGEEGAARESIACNKLAEIYFHIEDNLNIVLDTVRLYSVRADKFICVHGEACGYNNCRNAHTFEEALMKKCAGIKGEMSIGS